MIPQHPAYASESNAAAFVRRMYSESVDRKAVMRQGGGDPAKAVQKVYELSQLPDPPLRLLLGEDVNMMFKEWLAQVVREVEAYATWSDDLRYGVN